MKTILALDLGTRTGYAHNTGVVIEVGTWVWAKPKEITAWGKSRLTRRDDPRVTRFCEMLSGLPAFDIVCYEDVQFSTTTYATQLWASLRASVWLCSKRTHIECVPVGSLKLFATGHGAATKSMMNVALKQKHPFLWTPELDENAVDAAWVFLWATHNLGRMKI